MNIEEGNRIKVLSNIICNDPRELSGQVLYVDEVVDVICFTVDSSLKWNISDSGIRHVPGNNGIGWEKI